MEKLKSKRLVLGEGETVGHKHVLESKVDIEYQNSGDAIGFMLGELGILTHDEHDRIVLTPGSYRSYNQVEFNPMSQEVSRVFD